MGLNPIDEQSVYARGQTHALTRMALLTSLVSVGRLSFSFIPNVQPMTVLIVCITLYYGWKTGLAVSLLSVLLTNIYLGMGPWTFAQLAAYTVLVGCTHLLEESYESLSMPILQIFVAFLGLLYGLIISLVQAPFFGWNIFIPYYLSGLVFDILHAGGNVIFFALLYPLVMQLFKRTSKDTTNLQSNNEKERKN
ncbi:ECF transporter S component [Alkalibacterium kapii]|uniref:Membrane protein n=1 Tax=Alkalibacterium kapii TaxID=426704 RepID=A0A511AUL9_9LACT|nr:ECF transporter S component [Alkalibacterium kapii]GEK91898.1 membrane protein [Alkalibacterium kapii]